MKRQALIFGFIVALFTISSTVPAFAEHADTQTGKSKEMKETVQEESISGKVIRTHNTEGLSLTYRLIDMQAWAAMKGMETMADQMASHHLMVEVKKIGGDKVTDATVGFVVTSPAGKKNKTMTMFMKGGFGADVDLKERGKYMVDVTIKAGGKTVMDQFTHYSE